ncbi:MAG: hypothetical protein OSJ62_18065, partial [Lachnospiraceae bacterium]|nr:hypothetical protein [Lachnospiraceae bacterium]
SELINIFTASSSASDIFSISAIPLFFVGDNSGILVWVLYRLPSPVNIHCAEYPYVSELAR